MKHKISIPTAEQHVRMRQIAEQYFGTAQDPDQILINQAAEKKLRQLDSSAVLCAEVDGQPVSWVVAVPTTKELARKFLDGGITERELFALTKPQPRYEALYFSAVFTLPEYRKQGLAEDVLREVVQRVPLVDDPLLFGWTYSQDGISLYEAVTKKYGRHVELRRDQSAS